MDSLARGSTAYDRADWTTAADWARHRLSVDSSDPQALQLLARSSVRLGRDQSAIASYRLLMTKTAPELTAEDYYLLGLALRRQRQTQEAVTAWETGARIDPARARDPR